MNKKNIMVLLGGILFGFGLAYSGMTKQEIVLSFLQLKDLGLIFVLGGAAAVTFIAINIIAKYLKAPFLGGDFKPRHRPISRNLIIGAVIFGIGWGSIVYRVSVQSGCAACWRPLAISSEHGTPRQLSCEGQG